jgi:hypothetical protein
MAVRQVEAHSSAERHSRDMGVVDTDGAKKSGDLVGMTLGRTGQAACRSRLYREDR